MANCVPAYRSTTSAACSIGWKASAGVNPSRREPAVVRLPRRRAAQHAAAKVWFEDALAEGEPAGLSWSTIHAFLRIGTNLRGFTRPYTIAEAVAIVSAWLEHPAVAVLRPGDRYWSILQDLLIEARAEAALVTVAALAALAIEHGAVLCSTDRDFRRFARVRLRNPIEGAA